MGEVQIGEVTHWFRAIGVAGITLSGTLKVGDRIRVKGHTSDFEAVVGSLQIDHDTVAEAGPGAAVGVKLPDHAREHDRVYLVTDE